MITAMIAINEASMVAPLRPIYCIAFSLFKRAQSPAEPCPEGCFDTRPLGLERREPLAQIGDFPVESLRPFGARGQLPLHLGFLAVQIQSPFVPLREQARCFLVPRLVMSGVALVLAFELRDLLLQMRRLATSVAIFPSQFQARRTKLSLARDDRQRPGYRVLNAELR